MYIKQITVYGFKSYRDKIVIDDIFNGLNVIVGRNGSGKSNIFSAIEFALTMEYKYMKPEARSQLIFEGRVAQEPAYVEVVFDNHDRKLPVDDDTVVFRRILGAKKDRLIVNGKDLVSAKQFLDVAGFTNPYFIVKQGKVHDLAVATDAGRLKIISDVAGTTAYDARVIDCKQSLQEADCKRDETEKLMEELENRKESLEAEVTEQKRYLKRDQAKRAIEYVLHEREAQEIQRNLRDAEARSIEFSQRQKPIQNVLTKTQRDIQISKRDIEEMTLRRRQLYELRKEYEMSRDRITANLANHEQELDDIKTKRATISGQSTIMKLAKKITDTKDHLCRVESTISQLKEPLEQLCYRKCQLDIRVKEITDREHRKVTFRKTADYRNHLSTKIRETRQRLATLRPSLESAQITHTADLVMLRDETQNLEKLRQTLTDCGSDISTLRKNLEKSRAQQHTVKNRLETLWLELSEIEQKLDQQKERVSKLEEESRKCYGAPILEGLNGVRKIISDFKNAGCHPEVVSGYYGLLCENIKCDSKFDAAVEAAAGKRLLHHVVLSQDVAGAILREFNARNLRGEVNFIPLNGLRSNNNEALKDLRDCKPMADAIKFEERVASVVQFVFGSTFLCKSLESATETMRQHKVQCVTLDGEKVSKAGVLSGGYIRRGPQKIEIQRAKSIDDRKLADLVERKSNLDKESKRYNEDYCTVKRQQEKYELQRSETEKNKNKLLSEIKTAEQRISALKSQVTNTDRAIVELKTNISALEEKARFLEEEKNGAELGDDGMKAMTEFRAVAQQYSEALKEYSVKQKERSMLEAKLLSLDKAYYKELGSPANNDSDNSLVENKSSSLKELIKSLKQELSELRFKTDECYKELIGIEKMMVEKQKDLDELVIQEGKLRDQMQILCTDLASSTSHYQHLNKKLQEHNAASEKLGSVPTSLEKYENLDTKSLLQRLKKLNIKLKSKVEINQKAVQQFQELTDKSQEFQRRMESCVRERDEIATILRDLECKKGEAILQNIRVLQQQFRRIFCSIVPKGNAELILYGENIEINYCQDIDSDSLREMAGQNMFKGVKVLVNFLGKQLHNMRDLTQLSGGQKAIVALSLILAIQTIDPVPFYLFDEVDQALDTAYRNHVARLVAEMSERSQFICTTFRKEFVGVADKVYGVSYQNKCSEVQTISESQALDFVESDVTSEESSSLSPDGSFRHNHSAA